MANKDMKGPDGECPDLSSLGVECCNSEVIYKNVVKIFIDEKDNKVYLVNEDKKLGDLIGVYCNKTNSICQMKS